MTLPQAFLIILKAHLQKTVLPPVEMLDIASYFPTGKESSFITLYKK
jgi:hypothetical protein